MIRIRHLFRRPSPRETARAELQDAELELLRARSSLDYAAAMVQFHEARVQRLAKFLPHRARSMAASDTRDVLRSLVIRR